MLCFILCWKQIFLLFLFGSWDLRWEQRTGDVYQIIVQCHEMRWDASSFVVTASCLTLLPVKMFQVRFGRIIEVETSLHRSLKSHLAILVDVWVLFNNDKDGLATSFSITFEHQFWTCMGFSFSLFFTFSLLRFQSCNICKLGSSFMCCDGSDETNVKINYKISFHALMLQNEVIKTNGRLCHYWWLRWLFFFPYNLLSCCDCCWFSEIVQ